MRKLLINLIQYSLLLIAAVMAVFFLAKPRFGSHYTASITDKIHRLESIQEPKVILVGNSNLAFGIDSSLLEEAMGIPVVNLGLDGGLGNMFHYNMAKGNIHQGDIVVLANSHFDEGEVLEPALAWITIENREDFWKFIPDINRMDVLMAFPDYVLSTLRAVGDFQGRSSAYGPYTRQAFNEYGDNIWKRKECQIDFSQVQVVVPEITQEGIQQINEFAAYCRQQGAVCLLAGYPIAGGTYSPPVEDFVEMQHTLESVLGCEIISDFSDYYFDYSYFYDTQYHLINQGVQLRTQQLAEDLLRWKKNLE